MSTATVAAQKRTRPSALVEVCSVRLGETWFGVPITHILEIVGAARPQPVPLAPGLCRRPGPLSRRRAHHRQPAPVAWLPPKEGHRTSWCSRPQVDASACWSTRSAKCSPSPRPTTSPIRPSSTSAAKPCSPARTSSKTSCWSCSIPSASTRCVPQRRARQC